MTTAFEPPPTTREELARKTVDFLVDEVHRAESNRLPKQVLAEVGRALWHITSGLVPEDVSELCSRTAAVGRATPMKRHFLGKGFVRTVAWYADRPGYVIANLTALDALPVGTPTKRMTEVGEREAELETLFASLRKAGYVEL